MKTHSFLIPFLFGLLITLTACKKDKNEEPADTSYNQHEMWGYTPDLYPYDIDGKLNPNASIYGYLDRTGNVAITPAYDIAGDFSFDLAMVINRISGQQRSGYINRNGQMVIPQIFKYGYKFTSEGLAAVTNDENKNGYINRTGTLVIPYQYDAAGYFHEGLATVWIGDNVGAINTSGDLVIPAIYSTLSIFNGGYAAVSNAAGKFGFIDKSNNLVISYQYDLADIFVNGLARVMSGGKFGFIRTDGTVAIPFLFDYAGAFWEDRAAVKVDDLWGYIDKSGQYVVTPQYQDAGDFSEGLANVEQGNLEGYIDRSGNIIITPQYKKAHEFLNGIASVVFQDSHYGYIDRLGNILWKDAKNQHSPGNSCILDISRENMDNRDTERILFR